MTSEELSKNLDIKQCGCSGEAEIYKSPITGSVLLQCSSCGIETKFFDTESEAITAWNKAMGGLLPEGDPQKNVGCKYTTTTERTAKVEQIPDEEKTIWDVCECGADVYRAWIYCPYCGARLEWE